MEPLESEKEEYLDPIPAPLPIAYGPHYGMPSLAHHDSFNLRVTPPAAPAASLTTAHMNTLPPISVTAPQNPFADSQKIAVTDPESDSDVDSEPASPFHLEPLKFAVPRAPATESVYNPFISSDNESTLSGYSLSGLAGIAFQLDAANKKNADTSKDSHYGSGSGLSLFSLKEPKVLFSRNGTGGPSG